MRERRKPPTPNANFSLIPEFHSNSSNKHIKRVRKLCKSCRRGYTSDYLNTFSKINKICGECQYNPIIHKEYAKYGNNYKKEEETKS